MDIDIDSQQFSRIEVVETGRRRRWSEAEKLRILQERQDMHLYILRNNSNHGWTKRRNLSRNLQCTNNYSKRGKWKISKSKLPYCGG